MALFLRRLALLLLLTVVALSVFTARILVKGDREMALSEEAFDAGRLRDAVLHARRAAILYAPGAAHVSAAYERLSAVAVGAEAAGDRETAIDAWSAMRSASLESRHVFVPRAAELERANRNLLRLGPGPKWDTVPSAERAPAPPRVDALHLASAPPERKTGWIALLAAGLALSVAGMTVFVVRGVSPDGSFSLPAVKWAAVLTLVGAACWTVAVIQA